MIGMICDRWCVDRIAHSFCMQMAVCWLVVKEVMADWGRATQMTFMLHPLSPVYKVKCWSLLVLF